MRSARIRETTLRFVLAASLVATFGCSDSETTGAEDDGGEGGSAPTCGDFANATVLQLSDVTPAAGASVPNMDIVHGFTVLGGAAITFENMNFLLPGDTHSAGSAMGAAQFMVSAAGENDARIEFSPITWEVAPGNVYMIVQDRHLDSAGCNYTLPQPLFDYAITAP